MLYQNYLLFLQMRVSLEEKEKYLEKEIQLYRQKIKQNPNYKMIYHSGIGIND